MTKDDMLWMRMALHFARGSSCCAGLTDEREILIAYRDSWRSESPGSSWEHDAQLGIDFIEAGGTIDPPTVEDQADLLGRLVEAVHEKFGEDVVVGTGRTKN